MGEHDIFEATGCLPPCEWSEFRHNVKNERLLDKKDMSEGTFVKIGISTKGRFQEMEEYLIYDFNSFTADVGGYLGLLLGQSLYGIYQIGASRFMSVIGFKWCSLNQEK